MSTLRGYMAPEYAMHGKFSGKSDVFSFGVLVLEIVTGQKNNSFQNEDNIDDLISYVSINISFNYSLNDLKTNAHCNELV